MTHIAMITMVTRAAQITVGIAKTLEYSKRTEILLNVRLTAQKI